MKKISNKLFISFLFVLGIILIPNYKVSAIESCPSFGSSATIAWYYSSTNCTGIPFASNYPNYGIQSMVPGLRGSIGYTMASDETCYPINSKRDTNGVCTNTNYGTPCHMFEVHECINPVSNTNPISVTVTANPQVVSYGGTTRINWFSTGATSCTPPAGYESAGTGVTGFFDVTNMTTTTNFHISCRLAPAMTQIQNNVYGLHRMQVFEIGPSVEAGDVYSLTLYPYNTISVTAVAGDTSTSIATKLHDAIKNSSNLDLEPIRPLASVQDDGGTRSPTVTPPTRRFLAIILNSGKQFTSSVTPAN